MSIQFRSDSIKRQKSPKLRNTTLAGTPSITRDNRSILLRYPTGPGIEYQRVRLKGWQLPYGVDDVDPEKNQGFHIELVHLDDHVGLPGAMN